VNTYLLIRHSVTSVLLQSETHFSKLHEQIII